MGQIIIIIKHDPPPPIPVHVQPRTSTCPYILKACDGCTFLKATFPTHTQDPPQPVCLCYAEKKKENYQPAFVLALHTCLAGHEKNTQHHALRIYIPSRYNVLRHTLHKWEVEVRAAWSHSAPPGHNKMLNYDPDVRTLSQLPPPSTQVTLLHDMRDRMFFFRVCVICCVWVHFQWHKWSHECFQKEQGQFNRNIFCCS